LEKKMTEDHEVVLQMIEHLGIAETRRALEAWIKCQESLALIRSVYQIDIPVEPTVVVDHAHCND
jgi:hypothetical protein